MDININIVDTTKKKPVRQRRKKKANPGPAPAPTENPKPKRKRRRKKTTKKKVARKKTARKKVAKKKVRKQHAPAKKTAQKKTKPNIVTYRGGRYRLVKTTSSAITPAIQKRTLKSEVLHIGTKINPPNVTGRYAVWVSKKTGKITGIEKLPPSKQKKK